MEKSGNYLLDDSLLNDHFLADNRILDQLKAPVSIADEITDVERSSAVSRRRGDVVMRWTWETNGEWRTYSKL